jgi:small subunit ribosomal protein S29
MLPEGLPMGMVKEFEESMRSALLVRQSFLDLRDNFRRIVDPPLLSSDGPGTVFCDYSYNVLGLISHW